MGDYRTIGVFLLAVWFIQLAGGIIGMVTPVALDQMNASSFMIGAIASVYSAGFMAGALLSPALIRRVGNIRAFAAAAATGAVTVHMMGVALDPLAWAPLRLLQGAAFAVMFAAVEGWMGGVVPQNRRGALIGVYHLVAKAALLLGPFLVFGTSALQTLPYTLTGIFMALALIAVCLTRQVEPIKAETPAGSFFTLTRVSVAGTLTVFMTGVINTGTLALLPVVVAEQGWPMTASQAAIVALAAAQLGGLVSQWPAGRVSDHFPRRMVMSILLVVGAVASAVLFLLGSQLSYVVFLLFISLWGAGALSVYGLAIAHGLDRANPEQITPLMSVYLFVWATGSVIGPVLFGSVMTATTGASGLFGLITLFMSATGVALLVRLRIEPPPPASEQEDFSPVMTTSTVLSQVDPRTSEP